MQDDVNTELQALKNDMAQRHLALSEPIVVDNQSHDYTVNMKGELRQARYIATVYPLEEDPNGPTLICSYGLHKGKPHFYSSLVPK